MKVFFNFFFGTLGVVLALALCVHVYKHWDTKQVKALASTVKEQAVEGSEKLVEEGKKILEK